MNLLEQIEGLKGETLTSATLRWLLLRSAGYRETFTRLISDRSPVGPIDTGEHFAAFLESGTCNVEGERGRLDFVLESDGAVIGIENKLHAGFQLGQPGKYVEYLQKRASRLQDLRQRPHVPLLAVLAPEYRKTAIIEHCAGLSGTLFVSWQELLNAFGIRDEGVDAETRPVLAFLREYVLRRISFLPDFQRWYPHFRGPFQDGGSPAQARLVGALWDFFPDGGGRLSFGKTWIGYYFCSNASPRFGWYGFVPGAELDEQGPRGSELVAVTTFPVTSTATALRPVSMRHPGGWIAGHDAAHCWIVDFGEDWTDPQVWRETLAAFSIIGETGS